MKKITFLIAIFSLLGCGSTSIKTTPTSEKVQGPDGVKGRVVAAPNSSDKEEVSATDVPNKTQFTDSSQVSAIMHYLASDELNGRDSGSEGIEQAAAFIAKKFGDNKIAQFYTYYQDTLSNYKKPSYNMVGVVEGNHEILKNEFIIIGAHYDHIGNLAIQNGDSIANGANDNASGTTTVLELARYFGKTRSNKRSIIFALFSAEEKGLLGSRHLAQKLKDDALNLYLMLNFEMTGVPMVDKGYLTYLSGYKLSNLASVCNVYAHENLVGFLPKAEAYNLFQRSDNYPFHALFNVPAHTFSTFDFTNYDHYHKVGDEAGLMDFNHMATLINQFIPVIEAIANAPNKEIKYYE